MDPAKFRAYLAAEIGEKEAKLVTVPPAKESGGQEGNRNAAKDNKRENESSPGDDSFSGKPASSTTQDTLHRSVLRAAETVQRLWKQGLITLKDAAKMGPKSPTPEKAAAVAEARQELERIDRTLPAAEVRQQAKAIVQRHLGAEKKVPAPLEQVKRACGRLSPQERAELRRWLDAEGGPASEPPPEPPADEARATRERGKALEMAHEAINHLTRIPRGNHYRWHALQMVRDWLGPAAHTPKE
jgi:hypothetical protein